MSRADIVLTTLNARYRHSALGLRSLKANLEEMTERCFIVEFEIHQRPLDCVEIILKHQPRIVGIGVYIWNVEPITHLLRLLKAVAPEVMVVLGGPEASWSEPDEPWIQLADYLIHGEGETAFRQLCRQLLAGERPVGKKILSPPMDPETAPLPYALYTKEDILHRYLYVESSRGCPFSCEFCLSARDFPVRYFPLDLFLTAMDELMERGACAFKFVDRTFNLNIERAAAILDFFLARMRPGLFVHFEMVPDRLPQELKERLAAFPHGTLQLEIGVQSLDPEVQARIRRKQNGHATQANLRWLKEETQVHLHADLIFGLPGETLASMGRGFDMLLRLRPHDIQVGILKRLKGTTMERHSSAYGMVYNPQPPYDILFNHLVSIDHMQRLRRFARYWDMIGNSGRFAHVVTWLTETPSPFHSFLALSDWLYSETGQTHKIALRRLYLLVYQGLIQALNLDAERAGLLLQRDFQTSGLHETPPFPLPVLKSMVP